MCVLTLDVLQGFLVASLLTHVAQPSEVVHDYSCMYIYMVDHLSRRQDVRMLGENSV